MNVPALRCRFLLAALLPGVAPAIAHAQDSVAATPGNSDALSAYDHPVLVRYAVDLTRLESSWGNFFRIGPILKASADPDPMFSTLLLGATAVSPDHVVNASFPSTDFEVWAGPGQGINPDENTLITNTVSLTGFDRQFGVAFNDFSAGPNNVIGALIGQIEAEPSRVYVSRWRGMTSRGVATDNDSSTLSLGAIDASGNLYVRADGFNANPATAVLGDNVLSIHLPSRSSGTNLVGQIAGSNFVGDAGSSSFVVDEAMVTTNTPAVLPESVATTPGAIVLDFSSSFSFDGLPPTMGHLDAGIAAHRGNPSFSTRTELGGVGVGASLAKQEVAGPASSFNLFALNEFGGLIGLESATMPTSISDGVVTRNALGDSQFLQYMSQTSFRGPSGPVALGFDPSSGDLLAAATATDPIEGEFIAVARFPSGQSPEWTIAAYEGKPVLDGPNGASLGTLASASPVSMSSPAADHWGNFYFVASFQPTVGQPTTALFKAVNLAEGYQLELLLKEGDPFVGANSARTYTIDRITLGDSDSVASGSIFSSSVLAQSLPGADVTRADDPASFGGIVVNAEIIYNNTGTPENYQAVLFLGPEIDPNQFCEGDADGDGEVNFADITAVLGNWLSMSNPGDAALGDANNDGIVNFSDLTVVLGNWLRACP